MSLIELKNVSYSYNDSTKAVDDVSFSVRKGDYVTIIGHNGSGKSTLAKLIAGLLPVKEGSITVDSLEVNEENIPQIRKRLGSFSRIRTISSSDRLSGMTLPSVWKTSRSLPMRWKRSWKNMQRRSD